MTKTLYLLRHAKSDWSDPMLADHDRPLAARGRKAARSMGRFLAHAQPRPALVLCSSAVRARETWSEVAVELDAAVEVQFEETLYAARSSELLARIHRLPTLLDSVLFVGHNPGLENLASELAGDGDPNAIRRLSDKFPTAALATISSGARWKELSPASCRLESIVTPRDLDTN